MKKQMNRGGAIRRTTVALPETLDMNLDWYCLAKRISKGQVIQEAIEAKLREVGIDPEVMPNIDLPKFKKAK